jgi:hypothetical protein
MTAPTTAALMPEELATITVRYRLPRSEAQAVMLDERARQVSWDDVFAERDAQRAEIERLTAMVDKMADMSYHPEACPITGRPFFMTIDGKATYGGPFDSYTIPRRDDDGSLTCERYDHDRGAWREDEGLWLHVVSEEDLAERDEKLEAAETDISAAHQALTDARIPVIDDDMRVLGLDERVRMLAAERDALRRTLIDVINRGTDGGCAPEVSTEFLCFAADEAAGIKRQRDASRERERKLREAGQPVADAFRKHRTAMDAINAINEMGGDPGADIDALWREADATSEEIDRAMEQFCAALSAKEAADER